MSQADLAKWEPRYAAGRGFDGQPNPFFTDVAAGFLPSSGRALDLAGGMGRHSRWLAGRGLEVTLCDISASALALARDRAEADGLSLRTLQADLDDGVPAGPWDVVLVSHFLLGERLPRVVGQIAPGGLLLLLHPTVTNLQRHDRPSERWLLPDGAYADGIDGMELLYRDEGWGVLGRCEVRVVALRSAASGDAFGT